MTPAGEFPSLAAANAAYNKNIYYYIKTKPKEFYYLDNEPHPVKSMDGRHQPQRRRGRINLEWTVHNLHKEKMDLHVLPDPRLVISRHINWDSPKFAATTWSQPEPDNINRAICHDRPHQIAGISNQIWYRDTEKNRWYSCFYLRPEEMVLFEEYIRDCEYFAVWTGGKVTPMRRRLSRVETEIKNTQGRQQSSLHTVDERLIEMGMMAGLKELGVTDEYIRERVGEVRPHLRNLTQMYDEEETD